MKSHSDIPADSLRRIAQAEKRTKRELILNEEWKRKQWEERNRFNFDIQDNNPADPEQAGWDFPEDDDEKD